MSEMTTAGGLPRPMPAVILATAAAAFALLVVVCVALFGATETALQYITRYSARLAFLVFVTVLSAAALATLLPTFGTRWLRRNRRYLGLAFALIHFGHLAALLMLFRLRGDAIDAVTLIGGGLAYLLVGLMALTSNDRSVRMLGPRAWRALHLTGLTYVWLIFMQSYVGRLLADAPPEPKPVFAVLAGLGVAAVLLRIAARLRGRPVATRMA